MKRKLIKIAFFLLFATSLIGIIFTQLLGIIWSNEKLFTSCQPSEINYSSYGPYCLYIIKEQQTLSSKHIIFIGKEVDPNYGHALNFPTSRIVSDIELTELKVNWTTTGIELETYRGTQLFIPKKNFIGGR